MIESKEHAADDGRTITVAIQSAGLGQHPDPLVSYAIHFLVMQNCTDENKIKDSEDWGMLQVNSKKNSLVDSLHDYSLLELPLIQSSK
jgi:hypothetical protein